MARLAVYFGTVFATQIVAVFTLPLVTKNLEVSEYGRYSLMLAISGLLGAVSSSWIRNVAFRTFREADAGGYISQYLLRYLVFQLLTLALVFSVGMTVGAVTGNDVFGSNENAIAIVVFVASGDAYALALNTIRARERVGHFALAEGGLAVARLAAILFLIQQGGFDAVSILISYSILSLATAGLLSASTLRAPEAGAGGIPPSYAKIVRQGVPAIPFSLSIWAIASSDKVIIQATVGAEQLGVYTANYSIAEKAIGGITMAVYLFSWPRLMRINDLSPADMNKAYQGAAGLFVAFTVGPAVGVAMFSEPLLRLLADSRYVASGPVMATVAAAMWVQGFVAYINRPLEIRSLYSTLSAIAIFSAVVNVAATLIMIPLYGIMGAAVGTLLAHLAAGLAYMIVDRTVLDVGLLRRTAGTVAITILLASLARAFDDSLYGFTMFAAIYSLHALNHLRRNSFVRETPS